MSGSYPTDTSRKPSAAGHRAVGHLIARNSATAFVLFTVQLITGLLALPIALHALGSRSFGLVSFVTGFAVFLQFVELGISVGLARFTAAYVINNDADEFQSFVSDSYYVAIAGNLVVALGLTAIGLLAAPVLNIAPSQRSEFEAMAVIVGVSSALNGVLNVPRGILAGLQLGPLRMRRDMIGAVGPLLAALVVAFTGQGVVAYTVVVQLASLAGGLLVFHATRQVMPWVRHAPRRGGTTFRRFLSFSGYQVLNQGADTIFLSTDRVVVQMAIGSAAVTNYTIVERLQKLSDSVVSIPINAVIPASTGAWESGDRRLLEIIVHRGTRIYLAVILPPLTVLIGLTRPFLIYWVGPGYAHLALAGQLFVLSLAAPAFVRVFAAVLAGKGRFREQVTVKIAYAPINLGLSIVLASRLGVLGVVIPTTAYYAFVFPFVQLQLMHSEGFSVSRFLVDVFPVFCAVTPVTVYLLIAPPTLVSSGIGGFALCAAAATIISYLGVGLALRPNERDAIVSAIRKRIG